MNADVPPGVITTTDSSPRHFNSVAVGSTATRELLITNIGDAPLAITSLTFDDATHFSVPDTNTSIPPGGEMSFIVTYQPTSVEFHSATLSIANNDPDEGEDGPESPYELRFVGNGRELVPDIVIRVVGRGRIPIGSEPSVPLGTLHPTEEFDGFGSSTSYGFSFLIENEGDAKLFIRGLGTVSGLRMNTDYDLAFHNGIPAGESDDLHFSARVSEPGTYRSKIAIFNSDGDEGIYVFDVQITITPEGDSGARITSITANGADIDLGVELPAAGNYFIDESEDLTTWSLMDPPSFFGQQGSHMQTLPGRATPPASGQRFFRLRLEE